jgi:NADPH-dependent 2,4-dienoyl-CoA reductase/sulfur reductase-like enzyme
VKAPTIVVGASLAGVRTVQALRRRGYDEPILLVGAEPHTPYDRPPLSKEFLLGKLAEDEIALVEPEGWGELGVELRLGVWARDLDLNGKRVTIGDERVGFGTLIVATGSTPRALPLGARAGVHTFRTLADAHATRDAFVAGARVAVVGGGFIGAEIASAARLLGLDVTIIDPLPALMIRGIGAELGRVLATHHAEHGVTLRLGRSVVRIDGTERVERLVLDDGSTVDADVVVVGIGVVPATDWLVGSGLDVTDGLRCDELLRASADVCAVGDVARWASGRGSHRTEHWTNAVDQAAALAATLTGRPTPYDPLPYVWSDQFGGKLQVWGEVRPDDEIVFLAGGATSAEFVAVAGGSGALHGVVALGARSDAMRAMRMLRAGAGWQPGVGPGPLQSR